MNQADYPATVTEVLDDHLEFPSEVLAAINAIAASGPWTGSLTQRRAKFAGLNRALAAACGIPEPALVLRRIDGCCSGASHYIPAVHRIVMVGKLSVITFLHEFGHALGMSERETCRWSINLFRRYFPQEYASLQHCGHMLITPPQR
jgi:hypothetical protein